MTATTTTMIIITIIVIAMILNNNKSNNNNSFIKNNKILISPRCKTVIVKIKDVTHLLMFVPIKIIFLIILI